MYRQMHMHRHKQLHPEGVTPQSGDCFGHWKLEAGLCTCKWHDASESPLTEGVAVHRANTGLAGSIRSGFAPSNPSGSGNGWTGA
jgi:hypothetical protein